MAAAVKVVHVVAKTHLDLGFTALASEVVARYRSQFFPRAIEVAEELVRRGGTERLVWTTGSWMLHHALAAGSAAERARLAAAVAEGHLAWHALPVTTHTELMDPALVRSGLGISHELDARFGRVTTAAKMTDVPGHTRGLVSLLAEAGVTFLHIGVNPAWPVPDVPPLFRWEAPDGAAVTVAYQSGGYGGTVRVPISDEVLVFLHAGDNLGPPSVDDVVAFHRAQAARFPGAEVRASTLDAFARSLVSAGTDRGALPTVTAEIGDPWIFGAGSDPAKVAHYRALLRDRGGVVSDGPDGDGAARRTEADRQLLLVAEHTWGLDQKEALPDVVHWDRAGLEQVRAGARGRRFEASWDEQRAYVRTAARILHPGHGEAAWSQQDRPDATVSSTHRRVPGGEPVELGGWEVTLGAGSGAVDGLIHAPTGRTLVAPGHPLGLVTYQTFDEADYERFYAGLSPIADDDWWARLDNTKPGIDAAGAVSATWSPSLVAAWAASGADGRADLLIEQTFCGAAHERFGAPGRLWSRWSVGPGHGTGAAELELTVWWDAKPASRLPEALWCSFVPSVSRPELWTMEKLGQDVSPLDVVRWGGRSLHGIGEGGVSYRGPDGQLGLRSKDAPLVAPGRPNLLDADPEPPDLSGGWHVLLADNCWGTNFPMWIEGPARYRFVLSTEPPETSPRQPEGR